MAGLPFTKLPATGPMAQQAEREYRSVVDAASQEYKIEVQALKNQRLSAEQYNKKAAILHGKHSVRSLKVRREWNQRMTTIQQYEELGAAGTMTPERVRQEQYGVSGYDVPTQKKPKEQKRFDYWAEHQKLIAERGRMVQHLYDNWGTKWRKTRRILAVNSKGKVTEWGDPPTEAEQAQIDLIDNQIRALDEYEFALLAEMNPQQRKVNQLSRAMAMGPRVLGTPGVGKGRAQIPLGIPQEKPEREQLETPGYKMTKEKAITQAQEQLGDYANKERVIELAKLIFKGVELE